MTTHTQTTLVLGGTGKTGRRVAERLVAQGRPVRIGSRSGTPPFDWEDRATWAPALRGAGAAYLSFYPDVALPGAAETVGAFARLAVRGGTRRLVLISGRGEEEAQRTEELVRASGGDWTILRASWFAQNFSESFMAEGVLDGVVALPVGDVREPFVDADDIADVAVAALTEEGHEGRLYELTGPRLLTFAEAVETIAQASGREVRFESVPLDAWIAAPAVQELPTDTIALLRYLFSSVLDGRNAQLTGGVREALGRPPRDFADYACDVAATGAWTPQAVS